MNVSAGPMASLLLALLISATPQVLGVSPGLAARITDKGLEYGEKLQFWGFRVQCRQLSPPGRWWGLAFNLITQIL